MTLINLDDGRTPTHPTVVCVGFFDGVHLGHARLVATAHEIAKEKRLAVCVHTFSEMPAKVLRPEGSCLEITPLVQKAALLDALGVDIVAFSQFDDTLARMRAEDFFKRVLVDKLRAAHVVAGFHHRFGYHSEANADVLAGLCAARGIGLSVVPPVCAADGTLISSSAIRRAILAGDMHLAEKMLGRPYVPAQTRGDSEP